MKVNFDASYRELEKAVSATARPLPKQDIREVFGALLASIAPDQPQVPGSKDVSSLGAGPGKPGRGETEFEKGPMASIKLPDPEVKPPQFEPLAPPAPPVMGTAEGVKTPAVLEVRRLPSTTALRARQHAERVETVSKLMADVGRTQGIDPSLGMSVVATESSFNPSAVSTDGYRSKGLFQLLDGTGTDMHKRLLLPETYDPFNPEQNVKLGVAYLRYLHEVFATGASLSERIGAAPAANSASLEKLAVAAFNAGEGRVAAAQQRAQRAGLNPGDYDQVEAYLPEMTQEYVRRVYTAKARFDDMFKGS